VPRNVAHSPLGFQENCARLLSLLAEMRNGELGWLSSTANRLWIRQSEFDSRKDWEFVFFAIVFRPSLGHAQTPFQLVPVVVSPGLKRLEREADHSPPSSSEVKNAWSYTSTPSIRLHGVVLS
jgi:hypothetical protein